MIKEKLTLKSRTTTVAAAASEVKSVRFVSTEKRGYRVYESGRIGIFGTTGAYDRGEGLEKSRGKSQKRNSLPAAASRGKAEHIDVSDGLLGDKAFVDKAKELLAA